MQYRYITALVLALTVVIVIVMVALFAFGNLGWLVVSSVSVVSAVTGVFFAIYLTFYQRDYRARLEQENVRLKGKIDAVLAVQERERREAKKVADAARAAQRIQELAATYCQRLCSDSSMSQIKIVDMKVPLDLMSVYVQLRLHPETRPLIIEPTLVEAEKARDPNFILRANQRLIEQRGGTTAIDPDYALRRYKRCVILGSPGAGKTTLLKYLTLKSARGQLSGLPAIPIYIDLNMFVGSSQSDLLDFAATQWDKYGFPKEEARDYIEQKLQDGNALVLIDALDETLAGKNIGEAEESYERVGGVVRQLADTYPLAFIAVTVRTAGYQQHSPLVDFIELEILEFGPRDIDQFVTNWFKHHPESPGHRNADELNKILKRTTGIQALASNPLLLALIVMIYQQRGGELPDKRAKLYERCTDLLLEEWDSNQKRRRFREFKREDKEALLAIVAWHFHRQGRRYFPAHELLSIIGKFLLTVNLAYKQNENVLDEITVENGLLREQAANWYGFLHLTFQEYFAALAAKEERDKGLQELLQHVGDPWWEEVILLYAGSTNDASSLLQRLIEDDEYTRTTFTDPLFLSNLILAGHCVAAHPRLTKPVLRKRVLKCLFDELRHSRFLLTRQQLSEVLVEIGEEKIDTHSSYNVYFQPDHQLDAMVKADDTVNLRLLAMLSGEEEASQAVQLSIAQALGMLGNETVVKELIDLLSNEWIDVEVRMRIAQALGISGRQSIACELANILPKRLVNHDVRLSVAAALGNLIDDDALPQLLELILNKKVDLDVRCSVVDAIGASGRHTAVPHLQALYRDYQNKVFDEFPLYWHIIIALAALGEHDHLAILLPLLNDEQYSVEVRRTIINALGTLHLPLLVPDLLPLLSNKEIHWEVRVSIVTVLEAIGDRSITDDLYALLTKREIDEKIVDSGIGRETSKGGFVRAAIANILGSLGDRRYIVPLRRLDIDRNEDTRVYRSIITTRGKLGDTSVEALLLNWLTNYDTQGIEVAECLDILDALGKLLGKLKDTTRDELQELSVSLRIDRDVRRGIIALLPQLAFEAHTEDERAKVKSTLEQILFDAQSDQSLIDEAHSALWKVKRFAAESSSRHN